MPHYLALGSCAQAEGSPKDTSIADKSQNAPEGWLFEAEAEDADLPPDIKALLKLQAEEGQMGDVQEGPREELEPESSMIFGGSESAEDLQALPKVSTGKMCNSNSHAAESTTPLPGQAIACYSTVMGGQGQVILEYGQDCSRAGPKSAELFLAVQKELQEKLTQRGLPKSGNKAELAQRLHAALAEEQEMLLQDQMEARDELQRQFQQSMINPTSRCALSKHYVHICCVQPTSILA